MNKSIRNASVITGAIVSVIALVKITAKKMRNGAQNVTVTIQKGERKITKYIYTGDRGIDVLMKAIDAVVRFLHC